MSLQEKYQKEILPKLKEGLKCSNDFEIPKVSKIVINCGFGRNAKDKDFIENVVRSLTKISGQKPVTNKAKKSISSFKVREGMIIGAKVTLRGARMWDFLEKLLRVVFPNIRDFRGISSGLLDRNGNITVGFRDHIAFPEIRNDEVDKVHGLEICVNTTAVNKKESLMLLQLLGFPFIQTKK